MKFFIVGLHASGKQDVIKYLEKSGISCGKLFSNIEEPSKYIYNSNNYELYSNQDINDIFEMNAYIFLQEMPTNNMTFKAGKYYEGLSKYTFDNNDVFALSTDQFLAISPNTITTDTCIVWMDNMKTNRLQRYTSEDRSYNFVDRDYYETYDIDSLCRSIYSFNNSPVLYFTDEEPCRIATIIYTLLKHPDLIPMYSKNFN